MIWSGPTRNGLPIRGICSEAHMQDFIREWYHVYVYIYRINIKKMRCCIQRRMVSPLIFSSLIEGCVHVSGLLLCARFNPHSTKFEILLKYNVFSYLYIGLLLQQNHFAQWEYSDILHNGVRTNEMQQSLLDHENNVIFVCNEFVISMF